MPLRSCRPAANTDRCDFHENAACRQLAEKAGLNLFQRVGQILDGHALAIVRIDKARLDPSILANDKRGGNWKHPGIVALVLRKRPANPGHELLHLVADPDREVQRHGIAIVHVAENREIYVAVLLHFGGKFLTIRHNCNHARAQRLDAWLRLYERADADPAVRTPVTAMKSDHDGALSEQIFQAHEPAVLVGKHERRHWVTWLRRILAGIVLFETPHEPIDNRRGGRMELARGVGEDVKALRHRA